MVKRLQSFIGMVILMCLSSRSSAQNVIIVHPDCPFLRASSAEVKKIFMGEITTWRDKYPVMPVNQKSGTEARKAFFDRIMKMREHDYLKYWQESKRTSALRVPKVLDSSAEVVKYVRENKNTIGYIEAIQPREGVKIIFIDGSEVW